MTRDAIALSGLVSGTEDTILRVPLLHLNVRARRTAERHPQKSTAESRLGVSSLVTAHSARGRRVCWLKRFGPSKVVTEVGLSGLGSAKEATLDVSIRPASPVPGGSGPASLPSSPPGLAPAAGAIAGAVGARGV